jgi:hypothetical protein
MLNSGLPVNPLTGADNNSYYEDRPVDGRWLPSNSFRAPSRPGMGLANFDSAKDSCRRARGRLQRVQQNNFPHVDTTYGEQAGPICSRLLESRIQASRRIQFGLRFCSANVMWPGDQSAPLTRRVCRRITGSSPCLFVPSAAAAACSPARVRRSLRFGA